MYSSNHVLMSIRATRTVKRLPAIQSDSRESPLLCTQTTRIVNIICSHCTEVAGNIAFVHSRQIFQRNRLQKNIELELCVEERNEIDTKKTHPWNGCNFSQPKLSTECFLQLVLLLCYHVTMSIAPISKFFSCMYI